MRPSQRRIGGDRPASRPLRRRRPAPVPPPARWRGRRSSGRRSPPASSAGRNGAGRRRSTSGRSPTTAGSARIRPAMVGDIHTTKEGDSTPAASSVTTPSSVWARWRRTMLMKGIEPSSRRCGFQPVSRPERICSTAPDWITIMIEASAAETRISISVERNSRTAPPQPRRVVAVEPGGDHAEDLRRQQHADRQLEQLQARARSRSAARSGTARNRR